MTDKEEGNELNNAEGDDEQKPLKENNGGECSTKRSNKDDDENATYCGLDRE